MDLDENLTTMVRSALRRLYDPVALRANPLVPFLGIQNERNPAKRLREILTAAIEAMEPDQDIPEQSRAWRLYEILLYRYVQQLPQQEVADQLSIGVRHLRREEVDAIVALSQILVPNLQVASQPSRANAAPRTTNHLPTPAPPQTAQSAAILKDVLPGALSTVQSMAEQHHVHLIAPSEPELDVNCRIEAMTLRQVLINLLCVAIRQTPGGTVQLSLLRQRAAIALKLVGSGRSKSVSRDADDLSNLDLTARLLENSQAALSLSPPDAAFTATLTLSALDTVTVLLIDDNVDTLSLLQRYAANSRYRTLPLAEADRAVAYACETHPQLIVLDVMMPSVDGWELLGRLREHPQTRLIPLIVCSILAQEELARSLGASGFIHKPVTRQTFLSALDRQLQKIDARAHRSR